MHLNLCSLQCVPHIHCLELYCHVMSVYTQASQCVMLVVYMLVVYSVCLTYTVWNLTVM